ncbi:MAG: alpha/beta hydrolase [Pseudomonadota bacterium]
MTDPLRAHIGFSPEDFDAQYNLRAGRPDYEQTVIPAWQDAAKAARDALSCQLDLRYGPGAKQKLDVFFCGNPQAPVLIYFHGGYWQRGDKSIYSFLAVPFVAAGVNVVMVGYDLCPDVTITQISQQARDAVAWLWDHAPDLGLNREWFTIMGHSAGGHITQMMMATKWSAQTPDLPDYLIRAGVPISPLSYLEPVRLTAALNSGIRMDAAEAEAESPMTQHPPRTNAPQLVIVGGGETDEFQRQAQMYVDKFHSAERVVELCVVPDVDHFDELNVLSDPGSEVFKRALKLIL